MDIENENGPLLKWWYAWGTAQTGWRKVALDVAAVLLIASIIAVGYAMLHRDPCSYAPGRDAELGC